MSVPQYDDSRISVLCIGGANIDYCGTPSTALSNGQSARGTIARSFGGVALNVAKGIRAITDIIADSEHAHPIATEYARTALAGRTIDIALWSVIGNDSAGKDIMKYLADATIDGSRVLVSDEHRTGHYICIQDENGATHSAVSDIHAVESLALEQVNALMAVLPRYDAVFIDCNLLEPILHTMVPQLIEVAASAYRHVGTHASEYNNIQKENGAHEGVHAAVDDQAVTGEHVGAAAGGVGDGMYATASSHVGTRDSGHSARNDGNHTKIFCDPVSPQKSQRVQDVLQHLYYFAPNIDEAKRVTNTETPQDAIRYLLDAGVTVPIVTAGINGVWYAEDGMVKHYAIEPLTLTTDCGLGDWFNAAMLVGDMLSMPIAQCIQFAQRVVAHAITNQIQDP